MVISAEPHPTPPPADPVAGAGVVEEAASTARQEEAERSSFPSLKTWGSHRVCARVDRVGDAIAGRCSPGHLDEVREHILVHLRKVTAPGTETDGPADAAQAAAGASRPWKLRSRRRRPTTTSVSSPPSDRRAARARTDALDRLRFSVTLSTEEIEEDVYAVTGASARRRPRRRPRAVQKQLDLLLPGAWLSEITAESYRVPEDR